MEKNYTVSQNRKSGLWYAHKKGYTRLPIAGSVSEKKSEAMEYAKLYNCLPNRVQQIEDRRRKQFMEEMEAV